METCSSRHPLPEWEAVSQCSLDLWGLEQAPQGSAALLPTRRAPQSPSHKELPCPC